MRMNAKWMLTILIVLLMTVTAACSSGSNAKSSKSGGDKIKINIAYGNQPGEPVDELAKKWKELAEEKSNGKLELTLYPSSQLGSEKDVVEQATMGNNVIVMTGYDFLMDYAPDAGIMTAPYLTDTLDDLIYLTTTDWFKNDLTKQLNDQGIDIVNANTAYGERHLLTNDQVTSPKDLKGMKIRVPNNKMSIETFKALGASPTPTPLGDVYTSLQQGLIDGAENPLPVLKGVKAQEVSDHLALTGHQKVITAWIAGTSFMDTLPEDIVKILIDTGNEASEYEKGIMETEDEKVLKEFEEQGVKIHEVDVEPFKEKVPSVYKAFPDWTPGLYENIQELLENQ